MNASEKRVEFLVTDEDENSLGRHNSETVKISESMNRLNVALSNLNDRLIISTRN